MSKDEITNSVNTGYESDDDICIINEVFHASSPDNSTVVSERLLSESSVSENEEKKKRRHASSSDNSDSDKETRKKKKIIEINRNKELFVVDNKELSPFMCGFYTCRACHVVIQTQESFEKHIADWKHKNNVKKLAMKADDGFKRRAENEPTSHKNNVRKLKASFNGAAKRSAEVELADHGPTNISSTTIHGKHSKYPSIPHGVIRRLIKDESIIQPIVEENDFPPCPGLEKVIEIRGLRQMYYFCELCNITCQKHDILHHLKGQKHQLNSLEVLCPNEFKKITSSYPNDMRCHISKVLGYIQKREGIGRIVVEKEYLDDIGPKKSARLRSLDLTGTNSDQASTSQVRILSDASKSEYFCVVCECDLSDVNLWKSHSKSCKFNKNVKRDPFVRAPKSIAEPMSKSDCFLMDGISDKDNNEPLVGLDFIREMQHIDVKKETYHCFLCHDCFTFLDISLHIKSQRHRVNYLEHFDHESLEVVRRLNLEENRSYYIVTEICRKVERKIGSGHPEVYAIKNP